MLLLVIVQHVHLVHGHVIYITVEKYHSRTDTQVIEVFNYLREALPTYNNVTDSPFVMQSSSIGPITEIRIQERKDISLYISTTKMLMGIDISGISVVIFLRPLNMVHYVAQGAGRGGRKLGDSSGLRGKVVSYILWNNSDIASNVKGNIMIFKNLEFLVILQTRLINQHAYIISCLFVPCFVPCCVPCCVPCLDPCLYRVLFLSCSGHGCVVFCLCSCRLLFVFMLSSVCVLLVSCLCPVCVLFVSCLCLCPVCVMFCLCHVVFCLCPVRVVFCLFPVCVLFMFCSCLVQFVSCSVHVMFCSCRVLFVSCSLCVMFFVCHVLFVLCSICVMSCLCLGATGSNLDIIYGFIREVSTSIQN